MLDSLCKIYTRLSIDKISHWAVLPVIMENVNREESSELTNTIPWKLEIFMVGRTEPIIVKYNTREEACELDYKIKNLIEGNIETIS